MEGETKGRNGHRVQNQRDANRKGKTERPTKTETGKDRNEETDGGDRSTALLSEDDRETRDIESQADMFGKLGRQR